MLNPTMASAFLSKIETDEHAEYHRLEKRQSFTEKNLAQLGSTDKLKLDKKLDQLERRRSFTKRILETLQKTPESRQVQRRRSFTEKILETFQKSSDPTDSRLSYAEKILAIQSATHPGRPAVLPPATPPKPSLRIQVRVRCHRHFLQGFEKLEPTGEAIAERRHALAQKLIAKTLRRADRSRPRRRLVFRVVRRKMTLSPFVAWLREPLVRLARVASLAAAKVEIHQGGIRHSAKVTCFPLDNLLRGQFR